MSDNNDSELNDIKEGFKLFGSETNAIINPAEFKEIMELMNMNEKSPFLYNIVTKLCLNEEIQQKGGINAEEFISLLDQELDDTSTLEGLQNIFSIFSDNDNTKMSLPIISQLLNQEKDLGLEQDEEKIKKLFSRQEISGKKIDFDEFKDIMNTKNEKINKIFIKETSNNSNNKNSQINNNNNLNNIKFHDSNINNKINEENNLDNNINEINNEEINKNNNEELKSDDKINNFDSSNQENKLNKTKKRYRYMNKSSDNSQEKEEKEINNKEDEKIDKTEKRYHRRYREAKSPINKQKEENLNKDNKIEEQNSNNKKFSYSHWRFRGKK